MEHGAWSMRNGAWSLANLGLRFWPRNRPLVSVLTSKPHPLNPRLSVKGVELLPFGTCLGRPANHLMHHSGTEVGTIHQERPRLMYLKLFVRTWPTSVSDSGHEIAPFT